ncbi:MAG: sel1 repeat family protein [Bacteroides sp.]|nr:sel1 repeat family protein [Bacteroides sp.]
MKHYLMLILTTLCMNHMPAQEIDWMQMANTVWHLQSVKDAEGKFIQHTDEVLTFHSCDIDSEGVANLKFTWDNLPISGKISGGEMRAIHNNLIIFDLPDSLSSEYFRITIWDRAAQTITISDSWGLKRIFKSSKPIDLGMGFTDNNTMDLYNQGKEIKKKTEIGRHFYEKKAYDQAYEYFIEAARAGEPEANFELYLMGEIENNLKQFNNTDPYVYLYKAANSYNAIALADVGLMHKRKAHWGKAFTALRISASCGRGFSQIYLGRYIYWGLMDFYNGDNGPIEAVSMMRAASEEDDADPEALYWMGVFYNDGYGVEKSLTKAADYFRRSAENGSSKAQFLLGKCYYEKDNILGLDQDYSKAFKYFNDFINNNEDFWTDFDNSQIQEAHTYGMAYRNLSVMYRFGRGCSENTTKADEMIRIANEYGNPDAEKINQWLFGEK